MPVIQVPSPTGITDWHYAAGDNRREKTWSSDYAVMSLSRSSAAAGGPAGSQDSDAAVTQARRVSLRLAADRDGSQSQSAGVRDTAQHKAFTV